MGDATGAEAANRPARRAPAGAVSGQALFQRIYDELRAIGARQMRGQPAGHTLQPTALVHEVYLRLVEREGGGDLDRGDLLALAARAMRSVLVDHARRRLAAKRGGGATRVPLQHVLDSFEARSGELVALDEALTALAAEHERPARIVELSYFGGMTHEEVAATLGVSLRTVERDWRLARAWLLRELATDPTDGDDGREA